ncbi:MAG: TonB-dependent receptor plug domain-containing protein [Acidobacteria bacterium]|nr:TonB-dependent receptor plug domain-containing protein [Acidobacteriota bacterium]
MQRHLLWISLCLAGLPIQLAAQFDNAAVLGTVRDASKAVIPAASVTLTNVNTGIERKAQSNDVGNYQFLNVPNGQYQVAAEAPGFKTSVSDAFTVEVGARQRADLELEVGATSETVEVTGAAPLIETDSSDRGTVIGQKQAVDLPLNGRAYADLTLLTPGTTQAIKGTVSGGGRDGAYHVNGLRSSYNNFTLDGVDNNHFGTSNQGFSSQVVQLSPDAVGEFKVVTNNYSAEYGKAGGAIINAAYRSGTNQYHLTLWEFMRNTKLNATGFFKPQDGKPNFNQNQFGASGGGPIIKNKAFFFADYEGRRLRSSQLTYASIPTLDMRQGIIGAPVVDPFTGAAYGGDGGTVPQSLQLPYATKMMADLPAPNAVGVGAGGFSNNFESLPSTKQDDNKGNIKGDFYFNDKFSVFGRYSHRELNWFAPPSIPGPSGGDSNGNTYAKNIAFVTGATWTVSPTSLLEVRVGLTHSRGGKTAVNAGLPHPSETYGIPNLPVNDIIGGGSPSFPISGFTQLGRQRSNPQFQNPDVVNPRVNYSKIFSNHSIKVGFEGQWVNTDINDLGPNLGGFRFTGRFSEAGQALNPSGFNRNIFNIADFFVGAQSQLELAVFDILKYRQRMRFGYVQDDWKVNSKLTLNLGVRYEFATPQFEKNNKIGNFDPATNSLVFAHDGSLFDRALVRPDKNNWAPRIGAAYQLRNKTVLRGAYGISYVHFNRMGGENILGFTGPFIFRVNKDQVPDRFVGSGGYPTCSDITNFVNCFVRTQQGIPNNFLASDQYNPQITRVNMQPYDNRTAYVQAWHFTIQQQLAKDLVFDLGYVGNYSNKQLILGDYNQAAPITDVNDRRNINDRRPIDGFSQIQIAFSQGKTWYNGLQAKLEKRFSKGLYLLNAFTWSKTLDNAPGHLEAFNGDTSRVNYYNLPMEKGLSSYNIPVNNVTSVIWDIPFGHHRSYGSNVNPVVNAVLGGWRTTLIHTARSGYPVNVRYSPTAQEQTCSGCNPRPMYVGGPLVNDGKPIDNFFNQDAIRRPEINDPNFPFGNLARNVARGRNFWQANFGLFKEFPLPREGARVEFRSEFFNLFNRTNFQAPEGNLNSGNFGYIRSTEPARQIQFALKLYW